MERKTRLSIRSSGLRNGRSSPRLTASGTARDIVAADLCVAYEWIVPVAEFSSMDQRGHLNRLIRFFKLGFGEGWIKQIWGGCPVL